MATSATAARTYAGEYHAVFGAVCLAAQDAGLQVVEADAGTGVIALSSSVSMASWGEKLAIGVGQVAPGSIQVSARSALKFGLVDWGRNQKNLDTLFSATDRALAASHPPVPANPPTPAAEWHPDPAGRHEYRYWDGAGWTDQVSDSGTVSSDPLAGG